MKIVISILVLHQLIFVFLHVFHLFYLFQEVSSSLLSFFNYFYLIVTFTLIYVCSTCHCKLKLDFELFIAHLLLEDCFVAVLYLLGMSFQMFYRAKLAYCYYFCSLNSSVLVQHCPTPPYFAWN